MAFGNYGTEPRIPFDPRDMIINRVINLASNQRFEEDADPGQVPFSRGVKGPAALRGRNTPYKVTT